MPNNQNDTTWKNIISLAYAADLEQLCPYLNNKFEFDTYKGRHFVRFVAYEVLQPQRFPAWFRKTVRVELQAYVKQGDKRGVYVLDSFSPRTWAALFMPSSIVYPYAPSRRIPIVYKNEFDTVTQKQHLKYHLTYKKQEFNWHFICKESLISERTNSMNFFKNYDYLFLPNGRNKQKRVQSLDDWKTYSLEERFKLKIDFGLLFGEKWSVLNHRIPYHIMVVEGGMMELV